MTLLIVFSLLVTSELSIQENKVEEFLAIVHDGLEVSRSFPGNRGFDIYVEKGNPTKIFFVKQWKSIEHFQSYFQWRFERGDFELLEAYFSAPPVMRHYGKASRGQNEQARTSSIVTECGHEKEQTCVHSAIVGRSRLADNGYDHETSKSGAPEKKRSSARELRERGN